MPVARRETCDIIVIGGGSAAFEAAVAAREAGAQRVVMLEKAPESEYGGNARYSGTGFRFWHNGADEIRGFVPDVDPDYFKSLQINPYSKEDFAADLKRMTLGRMDPVLAQTLVDESNAAIHWMQKIGIRWELLKEHAKVGNKRYFEKGIAIHVARRQHKVRGRIPVDRDKPVGDGRRRIGGSAEFPQRTRRCVSRRIGDRTTNVTGVRILRETDPGHA